MRALQRTFIIGNALLLAIVSTLSIDALTAMTARAEVVERIVASGTVDNAGSSYQKTGFTVNATESATLTLDWTGSGELRMALFENGVRTHKGNETIRPRAITQEFRTDTDYQVAVWAYSGAGDYTVTITETVDTPTDPGTPTYTTTERTLAEGTADDAGVLGKRYDKYSFTVKNTEQATLKLDWTGDGDLRLALFKDGTRTHTGNEALRPREITQVFDAASNYQMAIWAVTGVGQFKATITETVEVTDPQDPGTQDRPNIVVINTDDQRDETIQYMPKLQQWLGEGGTTFTNGYVSTPSCCPSRSTLLSGRYVHNNGQYGQQNEGLDLDLTIERYMKDGGYFTGHAGKFIHWLPLSERAPYWDRWTYFRGGYDDVYMNFDGTVQKSQGNSTVITFDKAVEYVDDFKARDDSKPFFLYLAPIAPHSPSSAEPQYADAPVPAYVPDPSSDEEDRSDKPQFIQYRNKTVADNEAIRTAMIRTLYTVDDQIDKLMSHLEATGELDNTMVIFTSDNGYQWGEHKLTSKFVPYRKSIQVPFMIRWPGHVQANAVDARPVTHVDIAPTILAAAGVTQNHVELDGKDILSGYIRTTQLLEYYYDTSNGVSSPMSWKSIRTPEYQYTEYYERDLTSTTVTFREYYDMVNDPYQLVNLFADGDPSNDPYISTLSSRLNQAATCVGNECL